MLNEPSSLITSRSFGFERNSKSISLNSGVSLGFEAISSIASTMSSERTSPLATITSISSEVFPLILLKSFLVLGASALTPSMPPPRTVPMVAPAAVPKPSSAIVGIRCSSITATAVTSPAPIAAP